MIQIDAEQTGHTLENAAFLDAYSTRQKPARTSQPVWQRVRNAVEIVRALINCTAAVELGRRPPSSDLKGLGTMGMETWRQTLEHRNERNRSGHVYVQPLGNR